MENKTTNLKLDPEQKRLLLKELLEKKIEQEKGLYPLSYGQQGIWVLYKSSPDLSSYNIAAVKKIHGQVNPDMLKSSIQKLLTRHAALRTKYVVKDNKPFQVIPAETEIEVDIESINATTWSQDELLKEIKANYQKPFDLEHGNVFRISIFSCMDENTILVMAAHHIAVDGWSIILLLDELKLIYTAGIQEVAYSLPPLKSAYPDYVKDQLKMLSTGKIDTLLSFWKDKLGGELPVLNMPVDKKRLPVQSREGASCEVELNKTLVASLRNLALELGVTMYSILLAAYFILLNRYTNQEDIIIGTPVAGRNKEEYMGLIGYFVNMLPIRANLADNPGIKVFIKTVSKSVLEALQYQDYPFNLMVEQLKIKRDPNYAPVFQTAFSLLKAGEKTRIPGHAAYPGTLPIQPEWEDFDLPIAEGIYELRLELMEHQEHFSGYLMYHTDLYNQQTIAQIVTGYITLLENMQKEPDRTIGELSVLSAVNKMAFFKLLDDKKFDFSIENNLHHLFEKQVLKNPDNTALIFKDKEISYKELNDKANQLAHLIISKKIQPGSIVSVMMDRSLEMIVAILAILKSGHAYLPLDPDYPEMRKVYMVSNSQAALMLTQQYVLENNSAVCAQFKTVDILVIDYQDDVLQNIPNPHIRTGANDLAYIIYTSGSTGNPKGVMIEHASVLNLIQAQQKEFGITHKDRILLFSSICFDASVEQIFLALSNGAALVIADKDTLLDRDKFEAFIHAKSITHLHAVPSFLKNLSLKKPNHLKRVIAGGDDCSVELAKKFYKEYDFYNEYGPTETTVTSIQKHITHIDEGCANLAIGYPVYNTSCYLFDKHGNLVPPGAVGEIYLGGAGVARGYLNEPELTASKFIMDPFHNGGRLFKTGDYGKWHPASGITFLGRQDNQVKIRGFRIELEEIEKRIWDFEKKHAINHDSITDDKDGHITGENRITRCVKCLLPSNYKNITLDEKQVCSVCNAFDAYKDQAQKYFKNIDDLKQLFKEKNQTLKPEFDCMLLYSGGKDSTYVLYRLVELGYKVLALTFDNFFISDTAFENIKRNTAQLNVESMICQTEKMHEIFVESLTDDYTVCTGCFKALTAISTKIAAEKGIKIIVTGLSRGQIFDTKLMGLFQEGLYDVQEIENKLKLFRKLYHSVDDNISKLLDIRFSDHVFEELEFIDFFRYENVQPEQIKKYLITKDPEWSRPGDTGFCSTNCLINDAGIYIHHRATGYHNYAMPLSWDLRLGQKTPDAVRKELKIQWDRQKIAAILQEIGYFKKQIKDLKVLAVTDKNGEKKLAAYLVTEKSLKISKLRNHLLKELPDYMVPAYFVPLSSFPLTVNGKVDIKKLAAMQHEKTDPDNEYVPPRTRIESQLVDIWEQLLHIQKIGIYDNFFELGGNSLLATQVIWQIKETLNIEVHASELFKTPHISGLAELLEVSGSTIQSRPVIRKIDRDKYRKAEI